MADPGLSPSGLVVALQANYCWVVLDQPGPAGVDRLLCTRRSRLGKSGQRICVGDRVALDGLDWPAGRAAVARLEPRRNLLERPVVANVDRVVVVVALAQPTPDPLQLTRFLLSAEAIGQPLQLVLSKADLVDGAQCASWCQRLRRWGYDPIPVSLAEPAQPTDGLEQLRQRLREPGIAVLCGPSGVGKSSLLNALLPDLELRVGEVSGRLQRGRHTTRHVELFALPGTAAGTAPALLADTPGFNRPELPGRVEALASLFPEIRARLAVERCRYNNCRHLEDPGCAVGSDWERHPLYRQCLSEMLSQAAPAAAPEAGGLRRRGDRIEPRLQTRWRQSSRRRMRQGQGDEASDAAGQRPSPGG